MGAARCVGTLVTAAFVGCSGTKSGDTCIGRADAKHAVVYLHGMDTPIPSEQEQGVRSRLSKIASELGLRIALPRATTPCPTQSHLRCWGWAFDRAEMQPVLAGIERGASACFANRNDYGLVGFSNGGAAVSSLVQLCLPHQGRWHLAIASAGAWREDDPDNMASCGSLTMLVGKTDEHTVGPARQYADHLRSRGGNVSFTLFDGGHDLPLGPTRAAIEASLK